jgi:hypothetical protein
MQLNDTGQGELDEIQIVYLADKLVERSRVVGLDARFSSRLRQNAGDPDRREAILARKSEAEQVLRRVEETLGHRLEDLAAAREAEDESD